MTARTIRSAAALLAVVLPAAACAAAGEEDDVARTAAGMVRAAQAGDGRAACAALVPRAVDGLETAGARCDRQIVRLGLSGNEAGEVEVWGDRARARVGSGWVFLTRWGSGWKVTAAGCEPRSGRPYDCEFEA